MATHGGKRRNSGRKKRLNAKRKTGVWLTPEVLEYLATSNKAATIEASVRISKDFKQWRKQNDIDSAS